VSAPLVSICLPNLNTVRFLPERMETILQQTYTNWELIVSDNYSDDGAWEFFQEVAKTDGRVFIQQAPREGMYANWNQCIRRARGEFIYIATSDDTMPADCLQKLASALTDRPDCDIAHCRLRAVDGNGDDVEETFRWWSESSAFAQSSGPLMSQPHVRRAPFDGLLHLLGGSVYVSVTQLLIRRNLFETIGTFETRWGSVGDFNWDMRASLVANTVHVPDTWGGWRVHPTQATAGIGLGSSQHTAQIEQMIDHAIDVSKDLLAPAVRQRLLTEWNHEAKQRRAFSRGVDARYRNALSRRAYIAGKLIAASGPARDYVKWWLCGGSPSDWVRARLNDVGEDNLLQPIGEQSDDSVAMHVRELTA
jgi:glycosyltransferase involved in cell wall biosynthesis